MFKTNIVNGFDIIFLHLVLHIGMSAIENAKLCSVSAEEILKVRILMSTHNIGFMKK